ncbi:coiled-coil alpha-helical rod protein 1 isoform X2 [Lingula anatina]|nr:coiled-coil alpha-helical rod protein 1 isoform X2 [Lingula anatina]|eukprot:XP_013420329.1 coiled-coil alpha-helical rod protein 1 isoform X2 [Lingula anatina]
MASAKSKETLLPPSAFQRPAASKPTVIPSAIGKHKDLQVGDEEKEEKRYPWRELNRLSDEISDLRAENRRLRDKKPAAIIPTSEEIKARVDVHHSPSERSDRRHFDDIISRQATEVAELKLQLSKAKADHNQNVLRLEGQIASSDIKHEQVLARLQEKLGQEEERFKNEIDILNSNHQQELSRLVVQVSELKGQLQHQQETRQTKQEQLENEMRRLLQEKQEQEETTKRDLDEKEAQLFEQSKEIQKLQSYIKQTQEYAQSTEAWRIDKQTMERKLAEVQSVKEGLESTLQLLHIRLNSLNEILSIQEKELSKTKGEEISEKKKGANLLTRWREKVFALLVQQKSADIVRKKDEQNWNAKVSAIEQQLQQALSKNQMLVHSISDKEAQLEIERNNLKTTQNALTKAQELALSLDERLQQDRDKVEILQQLAQCVQEKMTDMDQMQSGILGTLKSYGQRISFASGRVEMLQGQFARKEAFLRMQMSEETEAMKQKTVPEKPPPVDETSGSYGQLCQELERVTRERDSLATQIRKDSELIDQKVGDVRHKYEGEIEGLRDRIKLLETSVEDRNQKCHRLSEQLEEAHSGLEEAREAVNKLKTDLARQQLEAEKALKDKQTKDEQQFIEQFTEMERKLNDARREHTKAVVSLRQQERQMSRERQRAADQVKGLEDHYKVQLDKLHHQLKTAERDKNLLMATLRQEGLLSKVKTQRASPVNYESDSSTTDDKENIEPRPNTAQSQRVSEPLRSVIDDIKALTEVASDSEDS